MPRLRARAAEPTHALRLQIRVYGACGGALGPVRAELLEHIDETGSIREAARRMEMSYNRAWTLVRSTNESFKAPLVVATRGGDRRGGARATRLLGSARCLNQAFALGVHLGLQFHVELTREWLDGRRCDLEPAAAAQPRGLDARIAALHHVADAFYKRWLQGARSCAPSGTTRAQLQ